MIESLKNTAVKVENEEQARVVVALYELAGFEDKTKEYPNFGIYHGIVLGTFNEFSSIGWWHEDGKNIITLDQLAWDYGLAPDWAVDLRYSRTKCFYWTGKDWKGIEKYEAINYPDSFVLSSDIISTRPQKQPQWPDGGLPPAGTECEVSNCGNDYIWCKIKFMGNQLCVVDHKTHSEQHYHLSSVKFRPTQSERDRVIDLACNTIGSCGDSLSIKGIAKSLYDAGMLKDNV